ncbi:MAG: glycoside hydrolase family 2 TIM barrel-domain containing protein, partial [bacterium]|nr:glycoside hydrolase family 2 TIM barrel-domain containing protein [bacterium]
MGEKVYLNGKWDFMPIYGVGSQLDLPDNLQYEQEKLVVPSIWRWCDPEGASTYGDFEPYRVFDYPEEWGSAETGVCHTTFTVDETQKDKRVFLCIDAVAQMSRIFLNGKFICDWDEMYLPLRVEVTDSLLFGCENTIDVVCTGFETVQIPSGAQRTTGLIGSWYGRLARGIWGDVYLDFVPQVFISDVTVRTWVRNRTLETVITLDSRCDCLNDVKIKAEVIDDKSTVLVLQDGGSVSNNSNPRYTLSAKWDNPIVWDIDNPFLYTLCVTVSNENGIIHSKNLRFGFREFWNEGTHFILNGKRINLRGDSWHFNGAIQTTREYVVNWFKMCKESGVNYVRLHAEPYPEIYLDVADEMGMLIVDETAIYGSAKSMDSANELYIKRCYRHAERLVMRDKNHPCVIFWSLQNEMRWVDGRDVYKKHIPSMINLINEIDPTRKVSVDGDNRLISYEDTQFESLHYNIDGTLEQWRREKPLTIGEHCGLWYICPQNASAYTGLKAYHGVDESLLGFVKKERLFVEDARRKEVSGISTFNFAFYFMHSMPDSDIDVTIKDYNAPGVKVERIPKHSLTINNGLLPDYPKYIPNIAMDYMRKGFKPVTIIKREYDKNFYDEGPIVRNFDIYNDTRNDSKCLLRYQIVADGEILVENTETWIQPVAQRRLWSVTIPEISVSKVTTVSINAELYHCDVLMHTLKEEYKIYPKALKTQTIESESYNADYGNAQGFSVVSGLLPSCKKIDSISNLQQVDVLILGNDLEDSLQSIKLPVERFVENGGRVVVLEQNDLSFGDLSLQKQSFFSASTSMPEHPILKNLCEEDFMFWHSGVVEERPESFIEDNFVKPVNGDFKFVLESGMGDYADGGDFWSPLIEYNYAKGTVIFNQLQIIKNFEKVPVACVLLRNILEFAGKRDKNRCLKVGTLVSSQGQEFLDRLCVSQERAVDFSDFHIIVAQAGECYDKAQELGEWVENGGNLIVLPFEQSDTEVLGDICNKEIVVEKAVTYHLEKCGVSNVTDGISSVDLYRYDKVPMSPRQVENTVIARNDISVDATALIQDVPGTPWHDYYYFGCNSEYTRIALVDLNAKKRCNKKRTFMSQVKRGKGRVILSQLECDSGNEKDIRIYSRIFANLGAEVRGNIFSYDKQYFDYSVDYFMTLPLYDYQDYNAALKYYTDKEFSLNNLGEGLYGWMLKIEKNRNDGYIYIPNSKGNKYFLTCFADYLGEQD